MQAQAEAFAKKQMRGQQPKAGPERVSSGSVPEKDQTDWFMSPPTSKYPTVPSSPFGERQDTSSPFVLASTPRSGEFEFAGIPEEGIPPLPAIQTYEPLPALSPNGDNAATAAHVAVGQTVTRPPPAKVSPSRSSHPSTVGFSSAAQTVDTGLRIKEAEDSESVILELPRGSPADMCTRMSPGDCVMGSHPCFPSHPPSLATLLLTLSLTSSLPERALSFPNLLNALGLRRIEAPNDPKIGDVMRLVFRSAEGRASKVEIIYTASSILQKAQETLEAVDAASSHARQYGDATGLILLTSVEQAVCGLLRQEYSIQENLQRTSQESTDALVQRVAGLEVSLEALGVVKNEQELIIQALQSMVDNYENSVAIQQQNVSEKSSSNTTTNVKLLLSDSDKSALILAQEKEILSLQRELHQTKQEVQKFLDLWPEPERLHELLAENERLRDVEAKAEIAKGETEALFRRACNLDRESEALRSMVQALGTQLLDAKKGLLDRLKIDGSTGGPFKIDHYDKAAENLRIHLVDENLSSAKQLQERLTVTLIERDDLATKLEEMQKVVQKYLQNADENKESISSRDKAIADLREQLTNNQSFYEEAITEMQEEVKKSVDEATQLKSKLEEAHEVAMQQLQKYVDDLEATASAEQRSAKLQFQSLLKEERDANAELREQLRKAEHQIIESFNESTKSLNAFEQEQQRLKEDLRQFAENTASQRVRIKELETLLTAAQETIQEENMKFAELAKGHQALKDLQNRLIFDLESQLAENQNLQQDLQKMRDALDSSQKECNRLETEISKLQDDLMAASALLDDRMEKDDKAAERQRDMRRKMEEQQKHNEELLELLQSQQNSLFKNSQDLAEYEGVLVKMAAELDEYRKIHGQLAARELRADAVAASSEKSAGSVISAPPGASPNRLEVQDTLAPVSPEKVQALSSTNHAPISAETAKAPYSTDDAMGTQLIESKSLGLVIKMEKGKVVVQDCLSGGVAAQSMIIDVGDEVTNVDGKDLLGITAADLRNLFEPVAKREAPVALLLSKKDAPSRSCRVVLKRPV